VGRVGLDRRSLTLSIRLACVAAFCLSGCCLEAVGPAGATSAGRLSVGTGASAAGGSTSGGLSSASSGNGSGNGTGTVSGTGGRTSSGSTTGPACTIDGQVFPTGTFNPADAAECCNVSISKTSWLPVFKKTLGFPIGSVNGRIDGVLGDLNRDGVADMVLVTHTELTDLEVAQAVVFLSQDGGFAPPAVYSTGQNQGGGAAIADLNGDGLPDVIVSTSAALDVFLNVDGGQLGPKLVTALLMGGCDAVGAPHALDVNSDGWLDVVLPTASCGRLVFVNDAKGDGVMLPPVQIVGDHGFQQWSTILAVGNFDTNHESYEDIAGGSPTRDDIGIEWFDQTASGMGFPLPVPDSLFVPIDVASVPAAIGDALLATDGTTLWVFPPTNLGPTAPASYPIEDGGGTIAVGDFNGDGYSDLLIASVSSADAGASTVDILLNEGDAGFGTAASISVPGSSAITRVAAGDLNGDGIPDMALVWTSGPWEVWLNECGPPPPR
jgi:hypothetical protein